MKLKLASTFLLHTLASHRRRRPLLLIQQSKGCLVLWNRHWQWNLEFVTLCLAYCDVNTVIAEQYDVTKDLCARWKTSWKKRNWRISFPWSSSATDTTSSTTWSCICTGTTCRSTLRSMSRRCVVACGWAWSGDKLCTYMCKDGP